MLTLGFLLVLLVLILVGCVYADSNFKIRKRSKTDKSPPRDDRFRLKISKPLSDDAIKPWRWEIEVNYAFWSENRWERVGGSFAHLGAEDSNSGYAPTEVDARIAGEDRIKLHLDRIARDKLTYTYTPEF